MDSYQPDPLWRLGEKHTSALPFIHSLLILGLFSAPLHAAHLVQKKGSASLELEKSEISFAEVVKLILRVEGPKDLEVEIPARWLESSSWKIRSTPAVREPLGNERVRWQQIFTLDPIVPGRAEILPAPIQYRAAEGDWKTVSWDPLIIQVKSQIVAPDEKNLRDITAIEELPAPPSSPVWAWLGAGLGLSLLFLGGWAWRRWREMAKGARSPEKWALRELDRLAHSSLPAQGKTERFQTLLAHVLRRFLEKKFDLPALRQTTPEMVRTLAEFKQMSDAQKDFLRSFFQRCDLAKFAQVQISAEECQAMVASARDFVQENFTLSGDLHI